MDLGLTGKRAAVAAASNGLGFAVARALAAEGCRVGVASRYRGRIEAAAGAIHRDTGAEVVAEVADLARPGAGHRLAGRPRRPLGRPGPHRA